MSDLNQIIDLVHPTVSGVGVFVTDKAWLLFDREIDETTIEEGNFFLTGPDFDTWIGPDLQIHHGLASAGSGSDDILSSPGFTGLVQGTITFERISLTSNDVVDTQDTVASGMLFRTKAIFTPENRLQADTTYNVYLTGDEYDVDALTTGISERTVFDTVASGINTGTGEVTFTGGYIGNTPDIYHVTITTAGEVGDARFTFYRDRDPGSIFGPFRTKQSGVLLDDCVTAQFSEGTYEVGDAWLVRVKPRVTFQGNLVYPFKTGSGSIQTLPDSTSTTVLGDIGQVIISEGGSGGGTTTTFQVAGTSPADGASNVEIAAGEYTITVTLNDDIDPLTVVSGVDVTVRADPVNGELASESGGAALGELIARPSVSGSTLEIIVASGQLMHNNLVTVTLDSTIRSTGGISLGSNYEFEFTTKYDPMYCTARRLRLEIGLFVQDVPEDTLNFAIHMASVMADEMTWNSDNSDDDYYKFVRSMWTCCKAQEILLINVTGGTGQLKSKRLGDLEVAYDTSGQNTNQALERALACQQKWEGALRAGGRQVQTALMAVRGELDPDRPPIGRGWIHSRSLNNVQTPVANSRIRVSGSRRFRNVFSRYAQSKGWWNS